MAELRDRGRERNRQSEIQKWKKVKKLSSGDGLERCAATPAGGTGVAGAAIAVLAGGGALTSAMADQTDREIERLGKKELAGFKLILILWAVLGLLLMLAASFKKKEI